MSEITIKPTPGKKYKVRSGDWISRIAQAAYGDPQKWPLIKDANIEQTDSGVIDGKVQEFFQPDDIIYIPLLAAKEEKFKPSIEKISGKQNNEFTLLLDEIEIPTIDSEIIRTMDTGADMWKATIAWSPGSDTKLDELTKKYSYTPARVYLGEQLMVNGRLYNIEQVTSESGTTKVLEGYSFTIDIVDSNKLPPYQKSNVSLLERAEEITSKHGIEAIADSGLEEIVTNKFSRITIESEEKEFDHLAKLAAQRGLLISSTIFGELFITRANLDQVSVGTIEELQPITSEFRARFDGRKRYSGYKALSRTPKKVSTVALSKDTDVPGARFLTFRSDDTGAASIKESAEWRRNKTIADSLTMQFPVTTWYAPNGELWRENTIVTVISKTLDVPDGFDFLIRRVQYRLDENGMSATLDLVPPEFYTRGEIGGF